MTELKPCPFCGGKAFITPEYQGGQRLVIRCNECSAIGPQFLNENAMIKSWNTRKEPKPDTSLFVCEICHDTGHYYDHLKFRSVKCGCQCKEPKP